MDWLERVFHLRARGSTPGTELRGALATFLTMAYILIANPMILSQAGVPLGPAVAGTALAAGVCCIMMGLFANFPLALASGMGLNAMIAYQAAVQMGSWQAAMGLVVLDGAVILILVLCGLREAVLHAIPYELRLATGAGIGFFIAFIGAVNARLIVVPPGTLAVLGKNAAAAMPPVTFGSLRDPQTALAFFGLMVTTLLLARRVRGALLLGILITTLAALLCGQTHFPKEFSAPSFATLGQADVLGALKLSFMPLLIALIMVDFFDTLGTVTAIAEHAGLVDKKGKIANLRSLLVIDSLSASIGGWCGVSSVTSYVESAAGVSEGARTGLHSVFVGLLFLLAIFLAPLAGVIPAAATAPALILIGFLMISQIAKIDFERMENAIPAFLTFAMLPLTYSISHGIGYGFISYAVIHLLNGKWRAVHPLMWGICAVFVAYFIWGTV